MKIQNNISLSSAPTRAYLIWPFPGPYFVDQDFLPCLSVGESATFSSTLTYLNFDYALPTWSPPALLRRIVQSPTIGVGPASSAGPRNPARVSHARPPKT